MARCLTGDAIPLQHSLWRGLTAQYSPWPCFITSHFHNFDLSRARSLFSSFKKAAKQTTDEDEFDKNMREALAEEEEKKNPKKKSSSGK